MFWLQLPSVTLCIYPCLPTSLSQLCTGTARAAHQAQCCIKAMAADMWLQHKAWLGSGLEEHSIPMSLQGARGWSATITTLALFLFNIGLLIPHIRSPVTWAYLFSQGISKMTGCLIWENHCTCLGGAHVSPEHHSNHCSRVSLTRVGKIRWPLERSSDVILKFKMW